MKISLLPPGDLRRAAPQQATILAGAHYQLQRDEYHVGRTAQSGHVSRGQPCGVSHFRSRQNFALFLLRSAFFLSIYIEQGGGEQMKIKVNIRAGKNR